MPCPICCVGPAWATTTVCEIGNLADAQRTTWHRVLFHVKPCMRSTAPALADAAIEQIEISVKYAGYIDKQHEEVARAAHYEQMKLPAELDYLQVTALSIEARQRLNKHRPETLGQASRLSGITPAAISLLLVHLKKGRFKGFAANDGEGEGDAAA